MANIIIVMGNILKRLFRKKSNILTYLILPVLGSVVILAIFSGDSGAYGLPIVIDDQSQTASSEYIIDSILEIGKFEVVEMEREEVQSAIVESAIAFSLTIPDSFEQDVLANGEPAIEILAIKEDEGLGWITSIVNYNVQNLLDIAKTSNYEKQAYLTGLKTIEESQITVSSEKVESLASEKSLSTQAIGMYLMLLMLSSFGLVNLIIAEKDMGTYRRISVSPTNGRAYILANLMATFIVITVQIIVLLIVLTQIININLHISNIMMFVILIAFAMCCVSIGLLIVVIVDSANAFSAALTLILTPTCLLSGCFFPIEFMPDFMVRLAHITPQRWVMDALMAGQAGEGWGAVMMNLAIVIGLAIVFFLGAAYRLNNQEK